MEQGVKDFLVKTDLDWKVEAQKLITIETGIEIPKNVAIVRTDTSDVLSVMGHGYVPYQNHELLELLYRVSQMTSFEITRGGYFGDGGKVYVQLKSGDLRIGNDKIEGYLTGINSFDGSTSLAFGASNVTVSCQNTFYSAFRQMNSKVRHTKKMVSRVDDICRELENVKAKEDVIFAEIKKLSETSFDPKIRDMAIRMMFSIEHGIDLKDVDKVSTRTRNQLDNFYVDLNGELADKGENMWGLFSGITKYTTHSVGKNKANYDSNSKMYNSMGKKEQKVFNALVTESNAPKDGVIHLMQ